MALDRTYFNSLVDDTGAGDGTPVDKAMIDAIYDDVDAALAAIGSAGATVQTTTSTGTQNDFAATAARRLLLRANNASLLTLTGFAAGTDGDTITIVSVGAGQVDLAHQDSGSTATNRLINFATVGKTSLAAGVGTATYQYSTTTGRWRLITHEQGAWITPTYASGDYTASSGTWTVDSGDVTVFSYRLTGRTLSVRLSLFTTSVSATPATLDRTLPGGFVSVNRIDSATLIRADNGGTYAAAGVFIALGGTVIHFYLAPSFLGTWATSTNGTAIVGDISSVEVQ